MFSSGPDGAVLLFSAPVPAGCEVLNADHCGRYIAGGPVNHLRCDLYSVDNDGVIGPVFLPAVITIFRVVRRQCCIACPAGQHGLLTTSVNQLHHHCTPKVATTSLAVSRVLPLLDIARRALTYAA